MKKYFYRINNHFGTSFKRYASGQIVANTMDEAHTKVMLRHNINIHTDYYDEHSMLAGCEYEQFYSMDGKKVEIAIFNEITNYRCGDSAKIEEILKCYN